MNRSSMVAIVAVVAISASACTPSDEREAAYADMNAVQKADHGQAGWVPPWVPSDAKDIRIKFDIDTNESILRFTLGEQPLSPDACGEAEPAGAPSLTAGWWPNQLPEGSTHRCTDGHQNNPSTHRVRLTGDKTVYAWEGA